MLVAQGDYSGAADLLEAVVEVQPLAEYAIAWGDALTADGRADEAADAYALVGAIAQLYEANGVNVDLELALYDADHTPGDAAVAKARKALIERPSIVGHDVLAWNLFRAGAVAEAADEMTKALATGSRDPQLRFHAAAIANADGDRAGAVEHLEIVLAGNPRFSAHLVGEVADLAAELGLVMPPAA